MSLWRRISYDRNGKVVTKNYDGRTSKKIDDAFLGGDMVTTITIKQGTGERAKHVPHNFFFDTFSVQNLHTSEVFYFNCIPKSKKSCKWFDESCNNGNSSICQCYYQLEIWPESRSASRFQSWCRCTDTNIRFFYLNARNEIAYKICLAQSSPCYENNTIAKIVCMPDNTSRTPATSQQIADQIKAKHAWFMMLERNMTELEKSIDLQFSKYSTRGIYSIPELDALHRSNIDFELVDCKDECCICLDETDTLNSNIAKCILELCRCKHRYHVGCILKWIKQGNYTCPLCRQNPKYRNIGTQPVFKPLKSKLGDRIDLCITFPGGIQSEHDPFPGSSYYGTVHEVVTNNNDAGNMLIRLFNKALRHKVLFNIVYQDGISFVRCNLPPATTDPQLYVEAIRTLLLDNGVVPDVTYDDSSDYGDTDDEDDEH